MRAARYLAARHAAAAGLTWCLLVALVLAVSFVEGTGALGRDAGGAEAALWLSALAAVQVGWQLVPVAGLIGLVVASAQLARSGELLGLSALGTPPVRLAAPFLAVAVATAALATVCAERALPPLARLEAELRSRLTHRLDARTRAFREAQHWFRCGETMVYLPRAPSDTRDCFARPTVFVRRGGQLVATYGADALVAGRAVAGSAEGAGGWQLRGAVAFRARPDTAPEPPQLAGLPRQLGRTHGPPGEHGGAELRRLIARRETAGLASRGHRLEAHHRRAQPALGVAWVGLALPSALRPSRRRSLVAELGAAALLVGASLAVGQIGRLLVHAAVLPAAVGCWLAPAGVATLVPWAWRRRRRDA